MIQRRNLEKIFSNEYNEGYNKIELAIKRYDGVYKILTNNPYHRRYMYQIGNSLSYADQETILEKFVRNYVYDPRRKKIDFIDEDIKSLYEDTLNDLITKENKLNEINNYINWLKNSYESDKDVKIENLKTLFNSISEYLSNSYNIVLCFLREKVDKEKSDYGIKRKSTKHKSRNSKRKRKSTKHKRRNSKRKRRNSKYKK